MDYCKSLLGLFVCYPGRKWEMFQLVNHVSAKAKGAERQRVRNGIARAISKFEKTGHVRVTPPAVRGAGALYEWVGSENNFLQSATQSATIRHPQLRL